MGTQLARHRKPARRRAAPARSAAKKAPIRPHQQREMVGVGLVGLGAFLGAQVYLGVGAGPLGRWLELGVRLLVGRLTMLAPLLLIAVGVLLVLDHDLLRSAPMRVGAAVGALSICTALAAGSFGLGGMTHRGWFDPQVMRGRGGVVGETVWCLLGNSVGGIGTALGMGPVFWFMAGASVLAVVFQWLSSRRSA